MYSEECRYEQFRSTRLAISGTDESFLRDPSSRTPNRMRGYKAMAENHDDQRILKVLVAGGGTSRT